MKFSVIYIFLLGRASPAITSKLTHITLILMAFRIFVLIYRLCTVYMLRKKRIFGFYVCVFHVYSQINMSMYICYGKYEFLVNMHNNR